MTSGRTLARFSAAADDGGEFAVDDERLGLAVIEHEGDRGRVEADVERVQNGAAHRDAVVTFEHRGRVGEHDRDRVAPHDAPPGEARRRVASSARRTRDNCGATPRERSPADPGTRQRRARERRAASAADNWRDCDRGRDHRAKGASGGAPRRFDAIIARQGRALGERIDNSQWRKAKYRKPTKVRIIATPLPTAMNNGRIAGVTAIPTWGAKMTQAE